MSEPDEKVRYTVVQGEYTSGIAARLGFPSHKGIWNDSANADIKKRRENPNILQPGDELILPKIQTGSESCATGAKHPFKLVTEKLMLRLALLDEAASPLANLPCNLRVELQDEDLTTNGSGKIETRIQPGARQARLRVNDPSLPLMRDFAVGIGELDPIDELSGQIGRLNNLGYNAGAVGTKPNSKGSSEFVSALEEFQCDHGLSVDGVCGPKTQAKLKGVHGC